MLNSKADMLDELSKINKVPNDKIQDKIEKLTNEVKDLSSKLGDLEAQRAKDSFNTFLSKAKEVNGSKILITKVEDFPPNAIKFGIELLSKKLGDSVCVFCSMKKDGTVFVIAKVSDNLISKVQAGKLVGEITRTLGGNGGGKPQMAQGMGKTHQGVEDILLKVEQDIINVL